MQFNGHRLNYGGAGPKEAQKLWCIQGCPLSMIGFNAIFGVILELAEQTCPDLVARSYADEISAIAVASSSRAFSAKCVQISPFDSGF